MAEEKKIMRKANRQSKRDQILMAALEVFGRKGYRSATIADVAKAAKVGTGTLYWYFKNKEELLQLCITEYVGPETDKVIDRMNRINNPVDRLYEFFKLLGQLLEEKPAVSRFLAVAGRQTDFYLHSRKKGFLPLRRYFTCLKGWNQDVIVHGEPKPADPTSVAHALVGSMDYILWHSMMLGSNIDMESLMQKILEIMKSGFWMSTQEKSSAPTHENTKV